LGNSPFFPCSFGGLVRGGPVRSPNLNQKQEDSNGTESLYNGNPILIMANTLKKTIILKEGKEGRRLNNINCLIEQHSLEYDNKQNRKVLFAHLFSPSFVAEQIRKQNFC
jgi:hypothetical protein